MEERSHESDFWLTLENGLSSLFENIGSNLIGWLIVAFIFIVMLVLIQKKKQWKRGIKVLLTLLVTLALVGATYITHLWALFGEAFGEGVDKMRWPVMLIMNLVTGALFLSLNLMSPVKADRDN